MSSGYEVGVVYKGKTAPPNAGQGDLFVDQTTNDLSVHNGQRFAALTLSALTVGGLDVGDAVATARANLLVNPGFEVHQRGGTVTADLAYAHDRWQLDLGGTSTCTVTDETATVDTGSGHALKAVYVHGSAVSLIDQKLEDYAQLRGRTVAFAIRVRKGVASSARPYIDDSGAKTYGSTTSTTGGFETLTVTLAIGAGATSVRVGVELSASDTVYLDNAVLVVGTTAPAFVPLPPADDLGRCQRYYQAIGGLDANEYAAVGQCTSTTAAILLVRYPVDMALAPTVTVSAAGDWAVAAAAGGVVACTSLAASITTTRSTRLIAGVASGLAAGDATLLRANATAAARLEFVANP